MGRDRCPHTVTGTPRAGHPVVQRRGKAIPLFSGTDPTPADVRLEGARNDYGAQDLEPKE